jgi:hypothetical protein
MADDFYKFKGRVWLYTGAGAWHFVTLPKPISAEIKKRFSPLQKAWGSVPVLAHIGKTRWDTSIFPDKKAGAYVLPLKAEVRRQEHIVNDAVINVRISIRRPEFMSER